MEKEKKNENRKSVRKWEEIESRERRGREEEEDYGNPLLSIYSFIHLLFHFISDYLTGHHSSKGNGEGGGRREGKMEGERRGNLRKETLEEEK